MKFRFAEDYCSRGNVRKIFVFICEIFPDKGNFRENENICQIFRLPQHLCENLCYREILRKFPFSRDKRKYSQVIFAK